MTLKLDYFPFRPSGGLFVGVDSNYARVRYEPGQIHERTYPNIAGLGPRVGYRFTSGKHLYLSPWVSVDHQFNAADMLFILAGDSKCVYSQMNWGPSA